MSEARVLIVDGDAERAESLRTVLDFIDHRPVVVGQADAEALAAFID